MTDHTPDLAGFTLRRNAVSGLIAMVIFVVIALLTGGGATFVIVGAVVVFLVSTAIGYAVSSYERSQRTRAG